MKDREGHDLRHARRAGRLVLKRLPHLVTFAQVAPVCVRQWGVRDVQSGTPSWAFRWPMGLVGYTGLLVFGVLRGELGVYLGFLFALVGTLFKPSCLLSSSGSS